ncbi:MAG: adenosylmethionine--8-amino-7-oxononanoate transaminase [Alphaproteobacteria bacterium]
MAQQNLHGETVDWLNDAKKHLWLPYTQMQIAAEPLAAVATEGAYIHLADGRQLVDGIASWWTACHGYNHPHIRAAIIDQATRMPHVMLGGLVNEPASRLAARLAAMAPGNLNHVFFSESGSVAVEIAMKMALQYWINRAHKGRTKFVCFRDGYHGDTLGAMSVCDPDEGMHSLFKGALLEQYMVDLPRTREQRDALDGFLRSHHREIAGVIVEPLVQGAGGMKFHTPEVLRELRRLCDRHGLLLILDEIMTGFGRTGSMFACSQADVTPDIMTLSKALTGGAVALAATLANEDVYQAFLGDEDAKALMHGPTFMGNALACAAANASLDLFETEPRLAQVAGIEAHLRDALAPCATLRGVHEVRVKGAIGVVQLQGMDKQARAWFKQRFIEEGVWLRPFGDIVYTTPPFTISPDELSQLTRTMVKIIGEWAAQH